MLARLLALITILCIASLLPAPSYAQAGYPGKLIRIIVAYPPGGASDAVARALAEKLSGQLSQQVIIENRAGAGGSVGIDAMAKSPKAFNRLYVNMVRASELSGSFGMMLDRIGQYLAQQVETRSMVRGPLNSLARFAAVCLSFPTVNSSCCVGPVTGTPTNGLTRILPSKPAGMPIVWI